MKNKLILSGCLIIDKGKLLLLYRPDHNHFETPGGKVSTVDCDNPDKPTMDELRKTAKRELFEELGDSIKVTPLEFFGSVEFKTPDGREAVANKFTTKILEGTPKINEPNIFSKLEYIEISSLENKPISPDLKILLPKIKEIII